MHNQHKTVYISIFTEIGKLTYFFEEYLKTITLS